MTAILNAHNRSVADSAACRVGTVRTNIYQSLFALIPRKSRALTVEDL